MKISLLTPTRQRPGRLARFLQSVSETMSGDNQITAYNYVDNDDPELDEYRQLDSVAGRFSPLAVSFFFEEPKSVSKSWNDLAAQAVDDVNEIIIMGNDDQIYRTQNWDLVLVDRVSTYKDRIFCAWFEDLINGSNHCAFPMVSSKWYKTLGYFTPGVFHFGYNDTWIYDIAKKIDRCCFIPQVTVEHMHFSVNKSEVDGTYKRNRVAERGNLYEKDIVIFKETDALRQADAEKLMKVMV